MKLSVGLWTWNVLSTGRREFLERTLKSLDAGGGAFDLHLVDGGSTDGSADLVREMGGTVNVEPNKTVGRSMNLVGGLCYADSPDVILLTADDYEYKPGWLAALSAFWQSAPPEIALASCNVEPLYAWNQVRAAKDIGGVRALYRDSLPGSNWSFRAADWLNIYPVKEITGGEDFAVIQKLAKQNRAFVALDLAAHIGETQSAWGNKSYLQAQPLDRAAWGLDAV